MSWCDKLASLPTLGIRLNPHFAASAELLALLTPMLDKIPLTQDMTAGFQIAAQDSFGVDLQTEEGFHYGVDFQTLFVEFRHRLKVKSVSAGPPIMELVSTPRPFTELLPEVEKRLLGVVEGVLAMKPRLIRHIGLVSTTIVDEEEAPPGIRRFLHYVSRPWKTAASFYSFEITTALSGGDGFTDRCVHTLRRQEASEGLVTLKFDYQRTYSGDKPAVANGLSGQLRGVHEAALAYFEDLAEGNRFDDNIIGNKNG